MKNLFVSIFVVYSLLFIAAESGASVVSEKPSVGTSINLNEDQHDFSVLKVEVFKSTKVVTLQISDSKGKTQPRVIEVTFHYTSPLVLQYSQKFPNTITPISSTRIRAVVKGTGEGSNGALISSNYMIMSTWIDLAARSANVKIQN